MTSAGDLRVNFVGDCHASSHHVSIYDGTRRITRSGDGSRSSFTFPASQYDVWELTTRSVIDGRSVTGQDTIFSLAPMDQTNFRALAANAPTDVHVLWSAEDVVDVQDDLSNAGTGVLVAGAGLVGTTLAHPVAGLISVGGLVYSLESFDDASDQAMAARSHFDEELNDFLASEGLPAIPERGAYGHNTVYEEVQAWEDFHRDLPGQIAERFGREADPYELARFVEGLYAEHRARWGEPGPRNPMNPSPLNGNCPGSVGCNDDFDQDNDGIPDLIDPDKDGDNIPNGIDRYPDTPYSPDSDEDGIRDQDDDDRDGDGIPNLIDDEPDEPYVPPSTSPGGGGGDDDGDDGDDPWDDHEPVGPGGGGCGDHGACA